MSLAVITTMFNCKPNSFRHKHYKTFMENIGKVPVFTVELAFDNYPFILNPNDNILQLRSGTWIWQRDRILNKLLEIIPEKYNVIAAVDADILFHDSKWATKTEKMLEDCYVGQMWNTCYHSVEHINPDKGMVNRDKGIVHTGYAWAYQRSFLKEFGFYDKMPVGGNDVLMTAAFCHWYQHPYFKNFSQLFINQFSKWGNAVAQKTQGEVGFLNSDITHLWHGEKKDRNYIGRLEFVKDYDSETDLRVAENGCYEWATNKPEMQANIAAYMKSRMDG